MCASVRTYTLAFRGLPLFPVILAVQGVRLVLAVQGVRLVVVKAALTNYCLLTWVDGVCGGLWVWDARTGQGRPGRLCKVAKVQEEQRLPDTRPSMGASRRMLDVLEVELVVTVGTVLE